MRLPVLSLMLIAAGLAADALPAAAQSPTSYPWCARIPKTDGDATSCYFTSYQQCLATASGRDAYCAANPYFNAKAELLPHRKMSRRRF